MLNEIKFLGFSLGVQFFAIFFMVLFGIAVIFLMDRIWPSRPHLVKEWENLGALAIIVIAIVLVT